MIFPAWLGSSEGGTVIVYAEPIDIVIDNDSLLCVVDEDEILCEIDDQPLILIWSAP